MSTKAKKAIIEKLQSLTIQRLNVPIEKMAAILNPMLRGWMNYSCKFNKWTTASLWISVNVRLAKWLKSYKKWQKKRAFAWLRSVYKKRPDTFVHSQLARP